MSTKYKLYYFPSIGRAEFIRYIFSYAKIPYDEVTIPGPEWYTVWKSKMPMGVIPVLELSDGRQLSQSLAIGRYLATMHGLVSDDPFENAWGDQLVGAVEDIYPKYYSDYVYAHVAMDEEKKRNAMQDLKTKALDPLFGILENFIADKKFFCSNKMHWADLVIAELVHRVQTLFNMNVAQKYPKLAAHCERIHDTPALRNYLKNRKPSENPF